MRTLNRYNLNKLVKDITHRITIQQYLLEHVVRNSDKESMDKLKNLKDGKNTISIICPFHEEKKPSFRIHADKNDYFCYGACRRGGGVIQLHSHYLETNENKFLDYPDLVEDLARLYGIKYDPIYDNIGSSSVYEKPITEKDFEKIRKDDMTFDKDTSVDGLLKIVEMRKDNNLLSETMYTLSLGLSEDDTRKEILKLLKKGE